MDWQGQRLSEKLMEIMLVVFAIAAFVVGYTIGSFQMMLLIYAGGVVLTTLLTVPNWPCFNRHPLNWLDPSEADHHPKPEVAALPSKKKGSNHHQKASDEEHEDRRRSRNAKRAADQQSGQLRRSDRLQQRSDRL